MLFGCSSTAELELSLNTFTDARYPCVRVVFPDPITLDDIDSTSSKNEQTVEYEILEAAQSHYTFKLIKRSFKPVKVDNTTPIKFPSWTLPITEVYEDGVILHKLSEDYAGNRDGAVLLALVDGDIYIRGLISEVLAEHSADDGALFGIFLILDRLVQKERYAYLFSLEAWRESKTGKRFIEDMKKQVAWFYNNISIVQCR